MNVEGRSRTDLYYTCFLNHLNGCEPKRVLEQPDNSDYVTPIIHLKKVLDNKLTRECLLPCEDFTTSEYVNKLCNRFYDIYFYIHTDPSFTDEFKESIKSNCNIECIYNISKSENGRKYEYTHSMRIYFSDLSINLKVTDKIINILKDYYPEYKSVISKTHVNPIYLSSNNKTTHVFKHYRKKKYYPLRRNSEDILYKLDECYWEKSMLLRFNSTRFIRYPDDTKPTISDKAKTYFDALTPEKEYPVVDRQITDNMFKEFTVRIAPKCFIIGFEFEKHDRCIICNFRDETFCVVCNNTHSNVCITVKNKFGYYTLECLNQFEAMDTDFKTKYISEDDLKKIREVYYKLSKPLPLNVIPIPYLSVKEFNVRYITDVIPNEYDIKNLIKHEPGIHCIMSKTGTGKTTAMLDIIDRFGYATPDSNPDVEKENFDMMFCSSKISYTDFLYEELRDKFPEMSIGNYMTDDLKKFKSFIIQAESLYKKPGYPKTIFIDEITAFIKQMTSKLHKKNLTANRLTLINALKAAETIICMDEDIDIRTLKLLHFARPKDKINLYINTYVPRKRTAYIYNKNSCMNIIHKLDTLLSEGQNIVIVVGSIEDGKVIERHINNIGYSIAFYNSINKLRNSVKTSGKKYRDLWQDYRVVMYTSSIMVGVDFNIPYFNSMFVFGHALTNNVREYKQMMNRIRKFLNLDNDNNDENEVNVYICNKAIYYRKETDVHKLREHYDKVAKARLNVVDLNFSSSDLHEYEEKGKTYYRLKDDIWTELAIDNKAESNISLNFFDEQLRDMLGSRNYTIIDENPREIISDNPIYSTLNAFEDYILELKKQVKQNNIEKFKESQYVQGTEYKSIQDAIKNGTATSEDIYNQKKTQILKYLNEEGRNKVNDEDLPVIEKNMTIVNQFLIERFLTVHGALVNDLDKPLYDQYADKYHYINELCKILGLKNSWDMDTVVSASLIREKSDQIIDIFNNIRPLLELSNNGISNYKGLMINLNNILSKWTGYKFSGYFKEGKRNESRYAWGSYKKKLIEKYGSVTNAPIIEWMDYEALPDKRKIQICNKEYKLTFLSQPIHDFINLLSQYPASNIKNMLNKHGDTIIVEVDPDEDFEYLEKLMDVGTIFDPPKIDIGNLLNPQKIRKNTGIKNIKD